AKVSFNPVELFNQAVEAHPEGEKYLEPGLQFDSGLALLSFGIAFVFGTAGLPHILMRFFTVPDAKAARGSVGWAVFLIGSFYIMVTIVGLGARALLSEAGAKASGETGNLAVPELAQSLGGGEGSAGGDIFLAMVSAVALATILAVVAGLVISASGAVAHDVWSNVVRKGRDSEKEEVWVAKIAAAGIGVLSIVLALIGGAEFNVSVLVGMAFCFASSVTFPALLLALWWREFNTMGAICGMLGGLISSAGLILLSNPVWPGDDNSPLGSLALDNPAIFCIPIGFLGCYLGTKLSSEKGNERQYEELYVRSETGLGAELAEEGHAPKSKGKAASEREPEPVA
ncbi:MAG TPA: cation acetate symporter, partial [Solirubrobacteraceae bacterium]|nr:cation acetate symporter [Solirubrobacteraceae bacterium]